MVRLAGEQQAHGKAIDAACALSLPERHRARRPGRQPGRAHGVGAQPAVRGSSRHSTTPRGLAVTASATTLSEASSTTERAASSASPACSASSAASSSRIGAIAGDLPIDGGRPAPATAPAARPSAARAARRRPRRRGRPRRRTATARHSRRAHRSRWQCRQTQSRQKVGSRSTGKAGTAARALLEQGHVDLAPAVRRRRRQRPRVAWIVEGRQRIGPRQGDKRVGGPIVMTGSAARRHERALTITVVP